MVIKEEPNQIQQIRKLLIGQSKEDQGKILNNKKYQLVKLERKQKDNLKIVFQILIIMELSPKVMQVSDLFHNNKLMECIKLISDFKEYDSDLSDFEYYQYVEIFKGLSFYVLIDFDSGDQCFEGLICYSEHIKLGKVDGVDVFMIAVYQCQQYLENRVKALQINKKLFKACQEYQEQNQNSLSWNEGIYHFGLSICYLVLNLEKKYIDVSLQLLIQHLEELREFKQVVMFFIGCVHQHLYSTEEGFGWFQKLENINPNYPSLINVFASMYQEKREFEKAEKLFLRQLSIYPNNAIMYLNIASHYFQIKQLEKAEAYFQKSIEKLTTDYDYVIYAQFLGRQKKYQEYQSIFYQILEQKPNRIEILQWLMDLEMRNENKEKCLEYLNIILEINPDDGIFEYKYGKFLMYKKEASTTSLEYLQKSLKKSLPPSETVDAYFSIAFKQKDNKKRLIQYFNTCNLPYNLNYISDSFLFIMVNLLNEDIALEDKINIIESQYGTIVQARFDIIIREDYNKEIVHALKRKQKYFITTLSFLAYKINISPFLIFKCDFNYWDLFID